MEGTPCSCSVLTHKVLWYQITGERLKELQNDIAVYAYTSLGAVLRSDYDHAAELILHFYPKIPKIMISFTYQGVAFEHYLLHTLSLQRRTLVRDGFTKERYCSIMYDQQGQETLRRTMAAEEPQQYEASPCCRSISRQRLLILIMVNALNIPANMVGPLAEAAGIHEDTLLHLISSARLKERRKYERLEHLAMLRDRYFTEMLYLQQQILLSLDRQHVSLCRKKLVRTRELLTNVRRKIHMIPANLSHSRVSAVLGIPKGTVDSSMHYLKKRYLNDVD